MPKARFRLKVDRKNWKRIRKLTRIHDSRIK